MQMLSYFDIISPMKVDLQILNNQGVLLAVSGGVDSMCMLDYFIRNYGGVFDVATADHGIRSESFKDCEFVKQYCDKHSVNCKILQINVPDYCEKNKVSVETGARILRHEVLKKEAAGRTVCLAHNGNDQAETVLLHILRGSGVSGGAGMQKFGNGYFRPFLDLTREEIERYAKEMNVPYVYDETNDETIYSRNYLRHNVFPLLTRLNPSSISNFCHFAELLRADDIFFDDLLQVVFAKTPVQYYNNTASVPLQIFSLTKSISSRVVFAVLAKLGYNTDIEQRHVEDVLSLADKQVGKRIDLPHGLAAVRDYDAVTLCSQEDFDLEYCDSVNFGVGSCIVAEQTVVIDKNGVGLQFDIDKIPANAVIRTRREGDVFTKFGGGTKKLKDYLIDKKIAQRERDKLPLVADGKNVLIIVGVEISELVKCENNSNAYKIYCKKE